jgi:hypothetical protein
MLHIDRGAKIAGWIFAEGSLWTNSSIKAGTGVDR